MKNFFKFPIFAFFTIILCASAAILAFGFAKNLSESQLRSQRGTSSNLPQPISQQSSQQIQRINPSNSEDVYFPIPELDIRIKIQKSLADDLVYNVENYPNQSRAYFTTRSLMAADPNAQAHTANGHLDDNPLGAFDIGVISKSSTDTSGRFPGSSLAEERVVLNGFYIYFTPPANIPHDPVVFTLQNAQTEAIRAAVLNVEPLQ